jgi:predicted DNA-binding protein
MVRTQIQLTDEQAAMLKAMSSRTNLTMAELVRQAIDLMAEISETKNDLTAKQKAIRAAGKYRSGVRDIAKDHDKYLAEAFK